MGPLHCDVELVGGVPLPDRGADFISVRDNLRAALTADIDLRLFGWAQMEEPNSMLNALTRNPGILSIGWTNCGTARNAAHLPDLR